MGENDKDKENPAPKSDEAPEVISPGQSERSARPRKDPPVLEGEAEILSEKTSSRPNTGLHTAPSEATSSRGMSLLATALSAGVLGALAVGFAGHFLGYGRVSLEAQDQAIAALEARVTALDTKSAVNAQSLQERTVQLVKRLEAAEAELAKQAQSPENIAAIRKDFDTLTTASAALTKSVEDFGKDSVNVNARLANLETTLTALNTALSALAPRLDETIARVTALEDKAKDPDAAGRATLGLALANLTRASTGPGPFKTELDVITVFLPDEPELAKLAPVAAKGVPTIAALKAQFPAMGQAAFDAERQADARSLWAKFWGNAKSLITIRRVGEISGNSTEAIIARMEERLKIDDLAAALQQARLLKGAAAKAAAPWVKRAQSRVAVDTLVRSLSARVASRLAKAE